MRTALCLGGAASLHDDIAALPIAFDGVVACNNAGIIWPGNLDAWVSLHPDKLSSWAERRHAAGHPPPARLVGHEAAAVVTHVSHFNFRGCAGSGSSGLFAVKVALEDLGFDRAVLCGIPLDGRAHFFAVPRWKDFKSFRSAWCELPSAITCRIRSMSGWTRDLLGSPDDWKACK